MSLTFVLFEACSCFAMAILMSSVLSLGLPPVLPLARAASRPALVHSERRLCSNSANIAMSWKNSMPVCSYSHLLSATPHGYSVFSVVQAFR